jgi:hypothetical protein
MITIFLIENYPWVYFCRVSSEPRDINHNLGEWMWVGRVL